MKERFAKLLLGKDMAGCGKGVCTALAISNAITNLCGNFYMLGFGFNSILGVLELCNIIASEILTSLYSLATIFSQIWRLEPLLPEKKSMWRREMELLLCVSDHIVELVPS